MKELIEIQSELKAPKGQYNTFGKYYYRSCEDILESVKPLLKKHNCSLTISDDIVQLGDRFYVKATARLKNDNNEVEEVSASARETSSKKGMDDSQITGTASSYARKYALNGLFCIDDTKDADTDENKEESKSKSKESEKKEKTLSPSSPKWNDAIKALKDGRTTIDKIVGYYKVSAKDLEKLKQCITK